MDKTLKTALIDFITLNSSTVPDTIVELEDTEILNYQITKPSHDRRMEFSYKGPLLYALIHERKIELAEQIIQNGANVTIIDSDGYSPLFYALEADENLCKLIAEKGGDTEKITIQGEYEDDPRSIITTTVSIKEVLLGNQDWPSDHEHHILSYLGETSDSDISDSDI